jgi:hypothetical protein
MAARSAIGLFDLGVDTTTTANAGYQVLIATKFSRTDET